VFRAGPNVASDNRETTARPDEQLFGRSVAAHTGGVHEEGPGPCGKNRNNRDGDQAHEVPPVVGYAKKINAPCLRCTYYCGTGGRKVCPVRDSTSARVPRRTRYCSEGRGARRSHQKRPITVARSVFVYTRLDLLFCFVNTFQAFPSELIGYRTVRAGMLSITVAVYKRSIFVGRR